MFIGGHGFVDGETAEPEFSGAANRIRRNDVAGEIADDQAEGIALHPDVQRRGAETDEGGVLRRLRLHVD